MLACRIDQTRDIAQELVQVANLGRTALDATGGEQSLDLLLGELELPQGDRERLVAGRGRMAFGVQLDAHASPGERVAKLMSQPGGELSQQPGSLRLLDRLPHPLELRAHPVDRYGEVRHLVTPAAGVELAEVARGDPGHLLLDATDPRTHAVGNPACHQHHRSQRANARAARLAWPLPAAPAASLSRGKAPRANRPGARSATGPRPRNNACLPRRIDGDSASESM